MNVDQLDSILENLIKADEGFFRDKALAGLTSFVRGLHKRNIEHINYHYREVRKSKPPKKGYEDIHIEISKFFTLYKKGDSYDFSLQHPLLSYKPNYYFVAKEGSLVKGKESLFYLKEFDINIYEKLMEFISNTL